MTLTARNSKQLSAQLVKFNATRCGDRQVHCNWGQQGGPRSRWFSHGTCGRDIKTGRTFNEVVAYVQGQIDVALEVDDITNASR